MIPLDLLYNGLSDKSILGFVESLEYTDRARSGESSLVVKLCNADGRFTGNWSASLGDGLSLRFGAASPEMMAIQKIGVEHRPRLVTWSAKCVPSASRAVQGRGAGTPPPASGAFVTDKKSWDAVENITLQAIAVRVCAECGLSLSYLAKQNPTLPRTVRLRETGYHFLERLCRRYGLGIRAKADAVQIVARPSSSGDSPQGVLSLDESLVVSLQDVEALPARCIKSARRDPRSGTVLRSFAGDGDGAPVGLDFDALDADSIYTEAQLQAAACELSVVPDARFVAGALLSTPYGLREVVEMRYTRTGDSESMLLITRGAR